MPDRHRRPLTAADIADALLFLPALTALLWWTVWLLVSARSAGSLSFFPFGFPGFCFLCAAAFAGLAGLWALARKRSRPLTPSVFFSRADGAAFTIGVALILLFWERLFFRGWMPVNALFLYVFHPSVSLVAESVQKGVLPLWNPWANGGSPLMADPLVAAFSPLNLPLFLGGFPSGFQLWLLTETTLFFSFTYLWLRDRGLSSASALAGGLLAVLNAYTVWHTDYLPHGASLLWMPAVLHAVERKSFRSLALATAYQILAGHYQYVYMTWLVVAVLLASRRSPWSAWRTVAAGAVAGGMLSSFQLFPTLELVWRSVRSGALSYEVAVHFSDSAAQMAKMLLLPLWMRFRPAVEGDPSITVFYVGVLALSLSVLGAARRRMETREAILWTGLGLFLALGGHNPLYRFLLRFLPGLSLFRFPAQWMGIALIGFIALAAEGLEALPRRWRPALIFLMAGELFLFHGKSPFLWVDPLFLSEKPAVLADLAAGGCAPVGQAPGLQGQRAMESGDVEAWRYGDLPVDPGRPDFAPWRAVKEALTISQGTPFHVREAKSITNHTLRSVAALQASAGSAEGEEALRRLGVTRVLEIRNPADAVPAFRYRKVEKAWTFCRRPDGGPVEASVDESNPNGKKIDLARPWPSDGILEVGEVFYPGWTAWAADGPRPTAPGGSAFRGVSLSAGDRAAFLRYDAPPFFAGALLSLLTLGSLVFIGRKKNSDAFPLLGAGLGAACVFFVIKGVYDLVAGQPYSNLFAPAPWAFVPARAFVLFAVSEVLAGLSMAVLSLTFLLPGPRTE